MDELKKNKKPDLRNTPPTSLRNTERESPTQGPARVEGGLHTVKPGVGAQARGQTTRE